MGKFYNVTGEGTIYTILQNKRMWWCGAAPLTNHFRTEKRTKANCISTERKFIRDSELARINAKPQNLAISQVGLKNRVRVKLVKISKIFIRYNVMKLDQSANKLSEISKIDKIDFHFHHNNN